MKRALSIILIIAMILSLAAPVLADEKPEGDFEFYFCMGDSIANKQGGDMSDLERDSKGWLDCSYPQLISWYYGLTDDSSRYYGAHAGWRTNEVRFLLDDDYVTDDYFNNDDWLYYWGYYSQEYMYGIRDAYREALSKADLITINLGNNDIIGNIAFAALEALEYHTAGNACDQAVIQAIENAKSKHSETEALVSLLDFIGTMKDGQVLIKNITRSAAEIIRSFGANWNALIESVLNYAKEDATIIVIGMYNPAATFVANKVDLPDAVLDMLQLLLEPGVKLVNERMSTKCPYSDRYTYVDITDVDLTGSGDGSHLGLAGHRYVFEQVVKGINSTLLCDHSCGTTTVNARESGYLTFGYSGDVQCDHCGAIIEKGHILPPVLIKCSFLYRLFNFIL